MLHCALQWEIHQDIVVISQVIDAARNIEDVHADIKNHSVDAIKAAENEPIGELWKWAWTRRPNLSSGDSTQQCLVHKKKLEYETANCMLRYLSGYSQLFQIIISQKKNTNK